MRSTTCFVSFAALLASGTAFMPSQNALIGRMSPSTAQRRTMNSARVSMSSAVASGAVATRGAAVEERPSGARFGEAVNDVIPADGLKVEVPSVVREIVGTEGFLEEMQDASANSEAVVVKFTARFCRACARIEGKFKDEAVQRSGGDSKLRFREVHFEDSRALCKAQGIKTLPHVQIFDGPKQVAGMSLAPSKFDKFVSFMDGFQEEKRQQGVAVQAVEAAKLA